MKISKPVLILSSAGLGLTLVYCGPGTNCTPNKAQLILRQKLAEMDTAESLPSKDQLLADVERLHKEGKISGQQFETFKKNINEQYVAPAIPTEPEAQVKALAILHQHDTELKAGITSDTPEMTRVLRLKVAESQGIITPEEAANAAGAQAAQTGRASSGGTPASVQQNASGPSAALLTFQTSNKIGLARLNELTEMYKADRITPHEYHHERAKIVATL